MGFGLKFYLILSILWGNGGGIVYFFLVTFFTFDVYGIYFVYGVR